MIYFEFSNRFFVDQISILSYPSLSSILLFIMLLKSEQYGPEIVMTKIPSGANQ
jgi:hypothetical protein